MWRKRRGTEMHPALNDNVEIPWDRDIFAYIFKLTMAEKYHDLKFLRKSALSDFACHDGEIMDNNNSGELPPLPDVDFAIVRDVLHGWHIHPDLYPAKTLVVSDPTMDYQTPLAAQLLAQFQSDAFLQHLFVSPFYAMAAWRMTDGSFLMPSSPVLLVPNSKVPLVATDTDISSREIEFKIAGAVCSLYFRMRAPEILREFVGKISALEIFVSEPLHLYDTYSAFLPSHKLTSDSECVSLDLDTGVVSSKLICTEILPLAWKANTVIKPRGEELLFHPFARVPLSEVDLADSWQKPEKNGEIEYGSYAGLKYSALKNGGQDEKAVIITIEGEDREIDIITRPLKLGHAGELKTLSLIALRGDYTSANMTITVYGSRDMLKWWEISRKKGGSVTALPHSPFRFFKVRITGMLSRGESLQGLSIR